MTLTFEQAYSLLDQAASLVTGTRQDHINLQLALQCMRDMKAELDLARGSLQVGQDNSNDTPTQGQEQ